MKSKIAAAKNFVADHKMSIVTTIAVAATAVAVLEQIGLREHDKFLKKHNLFDEYYAFDEN
jgi:hypothetical protein